MTSFVLAFGENAGRLTHGVAVDFTPDQRAPRRTSTYTLRFNLFGIRRKPRPHLLSCVATDKSVENDGSSAVESGRAAELFVHSLPAGLLMHKLLLLVEPSPFPHPISKAGSV